MVSVFEIILDHTALNDVVIKFPSRFRVAFPFHEVLGAIKLRAVTVI